MVVVFRIAVSESYNFLGLLERFDECTGDECILGDTLTLVTSLTSTCTVHEGKDVWNV